MFAFSSEQACNGENSSDSTVWADSAEGKAAQYLHLTTQGSYRATHSSATTPPWVSTSLNTDQAFDNFVFIVYYSYICTYNNRRIMLMNPILFREHSILMEITI